jgi:hypothetical protein
MIQFPELALLPHHLWGCAESYAGQGASPEGLRPFMYVWDLDTNKRRYVWRSKAPYYETPTEYIMSDPYKANHISLEGLKVTMMRESCKENAQVYIRTFYEVRGLPSLRCGGIYRLELACIPCTCACTLLLSQI